MSNLRDPAPEQHQFTLVERRGSGIAHGAVLAVGLPLFVFLLPLPMSLVPAPVVAYLISRSFRRRQLAWGAFQALQGAIIHAVILGLALLVFLTPVPAGVALGLGTFGFILFLYSLWAALDTLLGYDFRYFIIGDLADRVSSVNLDRPERQGSWWRRE